jgi:formylmethanofuran dehydrogenase subunit E
MTTVDNLPDPDGSNTLPIPAKYTADRTITAHCAVCGEDVREIPAHLYTGGEELCAECADELGGL